MKITVIGASGDVGRRIVQEALTREYEVVAVARSEESLRHLPQTVEKVAVDISIPENVINIASSSDLIISAVRPPRGQEDKLVALTHSILHAAAALNIRALITGGAARLKLSNQSAETVLSAADFLPEDIIPIALACQSQFELCTSDTATEWTYLSPPAMLLPGERTGKYRIGSDTLIMNSDGQSMISMEDFAVAMLDEAKKSQYIRKAFTVAY